MNKQMEMATFRVHVVRDDKPEWVDVYSAKHMTMEARVQVLTALYQAAPVLNGHATGVDCNSKPCDCEKCHV